MCACSAPRSEQSEHADLRHRLCRPKRRTNFPKCSRTLENMTAFIIGQMQIHSRDWMEEYFAKIPRVVSDNNGKFLVRRGDLEHLEGNNQLPEAAFIIMLLLLIQNTQPGYSEIIKHAWYLREKHKPTK